MLLFIRTMNPSLTLLEIVFLGALVGFVGAVVVRLIEMILTFRRRVRLSNAPFWVMPVLGAGAGLYLSLTHTYTNVAEVQSDMRALFSGVLFAIAVAVLWGLMHRIHQDQEEKKAKDYSDEHAEMPYAFMASAPPPQHSPATFWLILAAVVSVGVNFFVFDRWPISYFGGLGVLEDIGRWEFFALKALLSLWGILVAGLITVVLKVFSEQAVGRLWLKITYVLAALFIVAGLL